jgi:hypothetical protein
MMVGLHLPKRREVSHKPSKALLLKLFLPLTRSYSFFLQWTVKFPYIPCPVSTAQFL